MATEETFHPELLARITAVVATGSTVYTLGHGKPNVIGRIDSHGIEVTTERSESDVGGPRVVPAWMFNTVWELLRAGGPVERDHVDRLVSGRKVKRSSAVFAILALLDDVTLVCDRPLRLRLGDSR